MLGITPSRNTNNEGVGEKIASSFYIGGEEHIDDFQDFSSDNLLDSIDFDDMFVGMENEVDVLPDLEMDTEILGDFSVDSTAGDQESEIVNYNSAAASANSTDTGNNNDINSTIIYSTKEDDKVSGSAGSGTSSLNQGEEIVSRKRDKSAKGVENKGKKSSKNHQGKKKVKVDWTPELHRRFVQVVEQLGVDKAVPSRILELMGIDCLTRHNIASHLQKYRSHRKHLLAREAEAASWSQRRQIYNGGVAGGGCKREMINKPNWFTPTMAFPPMPHFRVPLHVWGHPPALWPAAAASDPLLSHPRLQIPNSMPLGTPCFQPPPTKTPTNFPAPPPVPGLPPHAIYKADAAAAVHSTAQPCPRPPIDFQTSKESIDAAIEDVLAKPWLPLPLGLKPPSTDSVVMELHLQGIEKIPPTG